MIQIITNSHILENVTPPFLILPQTLSQAVSYFSCIQMYSKNQFILANSTLIMPSIAETSEGWLPTARGTKTYHLGRAFLALRLQIQEFSTLAEYQNHWGSFKRENMLLAHALETI